ARWTGKASPPPMTATKTDPRNNARPIQATAGPRAIRFRVHAYGQFVARDSVGIAGFGVPRPTREKSAKHQSKIATPTERRMGPNPRTKIGSGERPKIRSIRRPA